MRFVLLTSFVAMLVLAMAGPAQAKLRDFDGTVTGGGTVDLDVVVKKNKKGKYVPKRVEDIGFFVVPISCNEDPTRAVTFSTTTDLAVSKSGAFSYEFNGFEASLTGKLTKHGTKASGQVSYGPNDGSGLTGCTTGGSRAWSAHS